MPLRKRVKTEDDVKGDYSQDPVIPDADGNVLEHECRDRGNICSSFSSMVSHARSKHKFKGSSKRLGADCESSHEQSDNKDDENHDDYEESSYEESSDNHEEPSSEESYGDYEEEECEPRDERNDEAVDEDKAGPNNYNEDEREADNGDDDDENKDEHAEDNKDSDLQLLAEDDHNDDETEGDNNKNRDNKEVEKTSPFITKTCRGRLQGQRQRGDKKVDKNSDEDQNPQDEVSDDDENLEDDFVTTVHSLLAKERIFLTVLH
ncbi:hypothetical protein HD806DRAFT_544279 [Xylariaceae sp. AK1471]|nr:hypothetical protein HD806DRAFT_544279 [Xylariaceae sp. AK1471]